MRHVVVTDIEKDAAQVIKGLRTENGLSLRQLAKKAGVSESGLSRWENRNRVPNIDVFVRIIKALDCDIVVVRKRNREV